MAPALFPAGSPGRWSQRCAVSCCYMCKATCRRSPRYMMPWLTLPNPQTKNLTSREVGSSKFLCLWGVTRSSLDRREGSNDYLTGDAQLCGLPVCELATWQNAELQRWPEGRPSSLGRPAATPRSRHGMAWNAEGIAHRLPLGGLPEDLWPSAP